MTRQAARVDRRTRSEVRRQLETLGELLIGHEVPHRGGARPHRLHRRMSDLLDVLCPGLIDLVLVERSGWELYPLLPSEAAMTTFSCPEPVAWCPDRDNRPLWLEDEELINTVGGRIFYEDSHIFVDGRWPLEQWRPLRRELLTAFEPDPVPCRGGTTVLQRLLWGDRDVDHLLRWPLLHPLAAGTPARNWARDIVERAPELRSLQVTRDSSWTKPGTVACGEAASGWSLWHVTRTDALAGVLTAF